MNDHIHDHIRSIDIKLLEAAAGEAVRQAVLEHARLGFPVCSWEDGRVCWHSPEEVLARFGQPGSSPLPISTPQQAQSDSMADNWTSRGHE
jgi:hypothetical protein